MWVSSPMLIFHSYVNVYQKVNLHVPMGFPMDFPIFLWFPMDFPIFPWFSHGLSRCPMVFLCIFPFSHGFPIVFLWFRSNATAQALPHQLRAQGHRQHLAVHRLEMARWIL